MVAQVASVSPECAALARAFDRAKAEKLVCFPTGRGTWTCKTYTLRETGPRPQDVTCSCVAGQLGLTCKHAVCVIFCRKWHVHPVQPAAPVAPATITRVDSPANPLEALFN